MSIQAPREASSAIRHTYSAPQAKPVAQPYITPLHRPRNSSSVCKELSILGQRGSMKWEAHRSSFTVRHWAYGYRSPLHRRMKCTSSTVRHWAYGESSRVKAMRRHCTTPQEVPFTGNCSALLINVQGFTVAPQPGFLCISTRIVRTIRNKPHTVKEEYRGTQSSIHITHHTTSPGNTSFFPQITQMLTGFIRDHSSCHSINVDPRNMREKSHGKED